MYVIIDYHSIGFPSREEYSQAWGGVCNTSKSDIKEFWYIISSHYKGQ